MGPVAVAPTIEPPVIIPAPAVVIAAEVPEEPVWRKEDAKSFVEFYAAKRGADAEEMWRVISKCENVDLDPALQSRYVRNGVREESYGLAMWNIPSGNKKEDGTPITKQDAQNPNIAVDEMARYFANGKAHLWSCY